jgi:hypothetical protein
MFLPRETPLELGPEHLLGLRLSLNTPVVSTEEIPTGPARAALAVHRDPAGVPTITLAVRPIQASHAVFYGLEEELRGEAGLAMGVDAALCFGESLGFLFDDDPLASGDVEAGGVFSLWSSIIGDDELSKVMQVTEQRSEPRAAPSPILDTDLETDLGEELLLEELALEDMPEGELLAEDLAPEPPARTEAAPTPTLTKFRALADPSPEPRPDSEEPPRRALLARVRLVKRAAKPEKPSLEPDPELGRSLRLLTSF